MANQDLRTRAERASDKAAGLLIFYMQRAWERAGLNWESDNRAEVALIVDHLMDAMRAVAQEEAEEWMDAHRENYPRIHADGSSA